MTNFSMQDLLRADAAVAVLQAPRWTRYPSLACVAGSGDLGVTSGPVTAAGGKLPTGHYVAVWSRPAGESWRRVFEEQITHLVPPHAEPRWAAEGDCSPAVIAPPRRLVDSDAAGRAVADFQDTARSEGFAAALRTYGRNRDFRLYLEGQLPLDGVGAASAFLARHPPALEWRPAEHGRSADGLLDYTAGELSVQGQPTRSRRYVEVWRYDAAVANWGIWLLLMGAVRFE